MDPLIVRGVQPFQHDARRFEQPVRQPPPFVGTNCQLSEGLTRLQVSNTLEVYNGDHGNRVRERFESHVLPFFSRHLATAP